MSNTRPVIFTAFANPHRNLVALNHEEQGIQEALMPLVSKSKIIHIPHHSVAISTYFDILQNWEKQVTVFHFGGHANSQGIRLQDAPAFIEHLGKELVERNPKLLELVFLNGCATYKLTKILLTLGVKAVIGTPTQVNDKLAAEFAITFYQKLANGDNLQMAFRSTINQVMAGNSIPKTSYRSEAVNWANEQEALKNDKLPWGLYYNTPDVLEYKLDQSLAQDENRDEIIVVIIKKIPRGPMVKSHLISQDIIQAYADIIPIAGALAYIHSANELRLKAINPGEKNPTTINPGKIPSPLGVPALYFWQATFHEASLHGPRMLAALLYILSDDMFPDRAKVDRQKLLKRLENYK